MSLARPVACDPLDATLPSGGDLVRLVLLGLPGAGKGTQGERLSKEFHIPHISTGSMFRAATQSQSQLGKAARAYMERGELVPDELAIAIVEERLGQPDCASGFLLDGFPRTVQQALALDQTMAGMGRPLEAALNICVGPEEAIRRIAERRVCRQCGLTHRREQSSQERAVCRMCGGPLVQRDDDTEATARRRLEVYLAETQPVVAHYGAKGVLVEVDGQQTIEAVFHDICQALAERGIVARTGDRRR